MGRSIPAVSSALTPCTVTQHRRASCSALGGQILVNVLFLAGVWNCSFLRTALAILPGPLMAAFHHAWFTTGVLALGTTVMSLLLPRGAAV